MTFADAVSTYNLHHSGRCSNAIRCPHQSGAVVAELLTASVRAGVVTTDPDVLAPSRHGNVTNPRIAELLAELAEAAERGEGREWVDAWRASNPSEEEIEGIQNEARAIILLRIRMDAEKN